MMDFLKGIPSWVWTTVLLVLFLAYYFYRNLNAYKKNRNDILEFQNKLEVGNEIVLNSGIHGKIIKLDKYEAIVEIAKDTVVKVERFSIVRFEKPETPEAEEKTEEESK